MDGVAAAGRDRLPVQGFRGTSEEIERQWYELVYRDEQHWDALGEGALRGADRRGRQAMGRTGKAGGEPFDPRPLVRDIPAGARCEAVSPVLNESRSRRSCR